MSGVTPMYLAKNHFILVDGKPRLVKDWSFGGGSTPHIPNTDELYIRLHGGRVVSFGKNEIDALPPAEGFKRLQEGDAILLDGNQKGTIRRLYGVKARGGRLQTRASIGVPPITAYHSINVRRLTPVK